MSKNLIYRVCLQNSLASFQYTFTQCKCTLRYIVYIELKPKLMKANTPYSSSLLTNLPILFLVAKIVSHEFSNNRLIDLFIIFCNSIKLLYRVKSWTTVYVDDWIINL